MNAIGASILTVLIGVVLFTPRAWALLGMMAGVLYLTHAQVVNVLGFNLFAIRFLELAGFIRVMARRELFTIEFNKIDRVVILLYCYSTLIFLIRAKTGQAYAIGMMVDALLCYFTFRALITGTDDLKWFLNMFILLLLPYTILVSVEMLTKQNPFTLIGGLSFVEREGRLRCMGSFRHPSLLGTLGASILPLYMALFLGPNKSIRNVLGIFLCLAIVYLANSGGPLSAALVGLSGWGLWPLRRMMAFFRRGLVALIVVLAVVMKAPVWYLPAKVSSLTGGDGWHRSYLMDVAFSDFGSWWFAGMGIEKTQNWFPYTAVTGGADITNQYLAFGLDAGVMAIALFILLITKAFQAVGKALAQLNPYDKPPKQAEFLLWGLGCALAVHLSTWLGITYTFDQTYQIWFMQLAAISSNAQADIPVYEENNLLPKQSNRMTYRYHRYRQK